MQLDLDRHNFTSIVLAGDRSKADSLIDHSGVSCKALIDIDGMPMVRRVIGALQASKVVHKIVLSGPEESELATDKPLAELVQSQAIAWLPPEASPSASAYHVMQTLARDEPVLLTTADHPLLTPEIVDAFGRQSLADDVDVTVGLAPYALVQEAYPDMKKTVLRFSDGEFCGCNLFAFLTPEGRRAANFWRKIEQERKKPRVVIGLLGWWAVLRYQLGVLPLEEALAKLSKRLGLRLRVVILPYANAAVDVDSVADYALVQGSFARLAAEDD
ncbi:MAG: nucleotidyltransferase family protein [Gammaproteobacteria bacterium]|nr:nucleotidyltransferase family protein [Gammaproteobacteria bacterium]